MVDKPITCKPYPCPETPAIRKAMHLFSMNQFGETNQQRRSSRYQIILILGVMASNSKTMIFLKLNSLA